MSTLCHHIRHPINTFIHPSAWKGDSANFVKLDFSHFEKRRGRVRWSPHPSKEVIHMRTLPTMMIRVLAPFAPLFSKSVFEHVQVLMAGAILAPGKRTISSALRAMGLDQQRTFHRYHRVLSRAKWSSMEASRILLDSLVETFVPEGDPSGRGRG